MNIFESGKCPVCKSKLNIAKLSCPECKAEFPMNEPMHNFAYLNSSQMEFLEIYLKSRGSMKAISEQMNCSYPTAKKKLDELLCALGYAEEGEKVQEVEVNMDSIRKPTPNATKASEIVRNKFIEAGGKICVRSYKGIPYELYLVDNGEKFNCPQLIPYTFDIFDVMVDVMLANRGKAKKGSGRKKLGDPGCEEDTIAGAILKNYYGIAPGGSGLDPAFVMIPVLEWAGIAKNEWGYVQLTAGYLSQIQK